MMSDTQVEELHQEVLRLRNAEAMRDLLQVEVNRLRTVLSEERLRVATLRDQLDELISDMSLMEDAIRELRGQDPEAFDFGP